MKPIAKALLPWFGQYQRPLPWRKAYDPYSVWVSEAILQQTRMEQGVPYYDRFMRRFPSVASLAAAKLDDVLKAWEGLGYYHAAAQAIVKQHGGKIPSTKQTLIQLPGFGEYIASAVASIAFQEDVPVVDGNVIRVISRLNALEEDVMLPQTRKKIDSIATEMLPLGKAREFNQALMELGALVCTPKSPQCTSCPIQSHCRAFASGKQEHFPVKPKKAKTPTRNYAALFVEHDGAILLRQRPHSGLLPGLWELPMVEYSPLKDGALDLEQKFLDELGVFPKKLRHISSVRHAFTHFKQRIELHEAKASISSDSELKWVGRKNVKKLALTKSAQKMLESIK